MEKERKILVLTPTLTGGSWVCIEELIAASHNRFHYSILGLGPTRRGKLKNIRIWRVPYFMYDKIKYKYGTNVLFNLLYQIPLIVITPFFLILRPDIILSNGFTPALAVMSLSKVFGTKIIIYYGSRLEPVFKNRRVLNLFKLLDFFVDYIFVNSKGSKDDVARFIERKKIVIIEHWTEVSPLTKKERLSLRKKMGLENKFLILYVGKLSFDKLFGYLLKVAKIFKNDRNIQFWFVGSGELSDQVQEASKNFSNIKYLGFVGNVKKLIEFYTVADITWSYADETYLARPAIESLATGTPIMVPSTPAILGKTVKLPKSLVPSKIGWLVDIDHLERIASLIKDIKKNKIANDLMRKNCVDYAEKKYSRRNIQPAVRIMSKLS